MNAIILSWPVRAISSTAPVRGVTARDLSCLEVVHHLGAVYDGVIFSGRAGVESRLSSNGRIFLICACFPNLAVHPASAYARSLSLLSIICSALLGSVNGVLLVPSPFPVTVTMTITMTPHLSQSTDARSHAPTSGSWLADYLDRVVGRRTPRVSTADAPPHIAHQPSLVPSITVAWWVWMRLRWLI